MNIDEIAEEIVFSFWDEKHLEEYSGSNRDSLLQRIQETKKQAIKNMLYQMHYEESMFSVVERPYIVAKSLYFMLTEESLSDEEKASAIKLCYFCLLKNYLKYKDMMPIDLEYGDLVSGCKLALVLISMQTQYLMYSIIMGQANYINPQAQIKNQILLFGGIIKDAETFVTTDYIWPMEDLIKDYFLDIYKELDSHLNLPIKSNLLMHKEKYTPIIKNITTSISGNLKESSDWMDF
ncbi:MAG: hypothetical protein IKY79_03740 [Bacteroidales bacterium]|nr:hypothetical protein [Bacteroidales bacterium]